MDDDVTVATLRREMQSETFGHHLDPGAARAAWSDARDTRPHSARTWLAAAAALVAAAGVAAAAAAIHDRDSTPAAGSSACDDSISTALLPTWAQAGFDPDGLHNPHVISEHKSIVGILFVPLRAHQPAGVNNKILWAARDGEGAALHIAATLEGSDVTQTRTVDLGPSTVDLPSAGCWRMALTWAGHSDTVAIRYG